MIRPLRPSDRALFLTLAREFYATGAVLSPIPPEYHALAFDACFAENPLAAGYIVECDGVPVGYGMTSRAYSQEAGGEVLWLEELYIRKPYRSRGLGSEYFDYIEAHAPAAVKRLRLEIEPENVRADALYKRRGFEKLGYSQRVKKIH